MGERDANVTQLEHEGAGDRAWRSGRLKIVNPENPPSLSHRRDTGTRAGFENWLFGQPNRQPLFGIRLSAKPSLMFVKTTVESGKLNKT